ncbi:MAG: hypothetical protein FOGNACKC_02033 [Anaerolineae bacterium]|nr:hypothetical protein [Anaerolineae bacterium]
MACYPVSGIFDADFNGWRLKIKLIQYNLLLFNSFASAAPG